MGGIKNFDSNLTRKNLLSGTQEFGMALTDLYKNYKDMKKDGTMRGDDYFHCKANYTASQRGAVGERTAQFVGDIKEEVDYFKNRIFRNISAENAYTDYLHDKDVNLQGRQLAKNPLYRNAKDACRYHRVKGINEKY